MDGRKTSQCFSGNIDPERLLFPKKGLMIYEIKSKSSFLLIFRGKVTPKFTQLESQLVHN